ncbi:MAG: hypothetical protein L0206_04265, partial [Actinobacteria bacterium]|nr:hypothetical protein [Actinomycetota bacterium]
MTKELPGGGRIVRDYDYNVAGDARGRLEREVTYDGRTDASGALIPVTHRESTWQTEPLFGGLATFTRRVSEVTRTCLAGVDCAAQTENLRRQSEVWTAYPHPESGATALYLMELVQEGMGLTAGDLDRRAISGFEVRYSAADYRILRTLAESQAAEPGTEASSFETVGRETTAYDAATGLPVETRKWIDADTIATTVRAYDPATGNLTGVTKPVQVDRGGPGSSYTYDPHGLFATVTENEKGHQVHVEQDVGTGAILARRGPNSRTVGAATEWESETFRIDGLGRVVERAVSIDDPHGGFISVVVARVFYQDDELPRSVRQEKLLDLGGADWVITEQIYDGQGRLIADGHLLAGAEAATRYHYDAAGNVAAVEVPDPTTDSGATVSYTYTFDGLGRVLTFTKPDSTSTRVEYTG